MATAGLLWWAGYFGTGQSANVFGAALCGGLVLVGFKSLQLLLKRATIETSSVYRILKDQPGRILWVFPAALPSSIIGVAIDAEQVIILCTDDARIERARGVPKRDLEKIAAAVRRLAPRAYYGLTEKNRKRYQQATGFLVQ